MIYPGSHHKFTVYHEGLYYEGANSYNTKSGYSAQASTKTVAYLADVKSEIL
jgi:hypothetical protein